MERIAKDYPGITWDDWFIDIMTAKLIDPYRRKDFRVMVLPNLYGDILTDEAAQIQGGVGTAGSANIGKQYAMFEAIHGSAPRMVDEGRAQYADPSSIIKAASMLLNHIGFVDKAAKLEMALEVCCQYREEDQDDRALGRGYRGTVLEVSAGNTGRSGTGKEMEGIPGVLSAYLGSFPVTVGFSG